MLSRVIFIVLEVIGTDGTEQVFWQASRNVRMTHNDHEQQSELRDKIDNVSWNFNNNHGDGGHVANAVAVDDIINTRWPSAS